MSISNPKMSVGELVSEFLAERVAKPSLDPACVLFPHVDTLRDDDVRSYFDSVRGHGYTGSSFGTVEEVREFAKTYQLITRCVISRLIG